MFGLRSTTLVLLALAASANLAAADEAATTCYDLLIRGGTLVDGTGAPPTREDLLIRGDRIVRIGVLDRDAIAAETVIDASGMMVTPGYIDTHSHGDPRETPEFENFLSMGVTTICLGQDGESPHDLAAWMLQVEAARPGPNVAMFVGHGTVRQQSGVGLQRNPTAAQLAEMRRRVAEAMRHGCFGLTTGLEYQPGSFANLAELITVARPVAEAGGLVMSHLRSEDDDRIEEALAELFAQGRGAGCPVHVSHLKVTYGRGASRAEQVLAVLESARQEGLQVTADIYPYTASYTGIGIVFPAWAKPPHEFAEVVRSRRAELAAYLRRRVALRNGPAATLFGTGPYAGKTLAEVAAELNKPCEEVLIDDIGLSDTQAAYFVMDAALQDRLLVSPHVMICSDGSPRSAHPRGHGAFARVIRDYVTERRLLSLAQAIHKMTGLPAAAVGLDKLRRGRLAVGYAADLLVFDPDQVRDHATFQAPHERATGFSWVIVNGHVVRKDDKPTGPRFGRLLKRQDDRLKQNVDALLEDDDQPGIPGASVDAEHAFQK